MKMKKRFYNSKAESHIGDMFRYREYEGDDWVYFILLKVCPEWDDGIMGPLKLLKVYDPNDKDNSNVRYYPGLIHDQWTFTYGNWELVVGGKKN